MVPIGFEWNLETKGQGWIESQEDLIGVWLALDETGVKTFKKLQEGLIFFFWSPRGSHVKWYRPNRLGKTLGKKIPGLDTILWGPDRLWTGFEQKVSGVDKNPSWLNEGFIGCPKGFMEKSDGPNRLWRRWRKKSSGLDRIPRGPDRCLTSLGWDWGQNPKKIARGPYFFFGPQEAPM